MSRNIWFQLAGNKETYEVKLDVRNKTSFPHIAERVGMRSGRHVPGSKELDALIQYVREHDAKTPHIFIESPRSAYLQDVRHEIDTCRRIYVGTQGVYQLRSYLFYLADGTTTIQAYISTITSPELSFQGLSEKVGLDRAYLYQLVIAINTQGITSPRIAVRDRTHAIINTQ